VGALEFGQRATMVAVFEEVQAARVPFLGFADCLAVWLGKPFPAPPWPRPLSRRNWKGQLVGPSLHAGDSYPADHPQRRTMNKLPTSRSARIGTGFTFSTLLAFAACSNGGFGRHDSGPGTDGPVGAADSVDAFRADGMAGAAGVANVVISAAARAPRTTTWSVNYWQWAPSYGNDVAGTESLVAAVTPSFIRMGGYNNDANTPDAFDDARMDALVTYAAAIGAQPIIQVPLLQDTNGQPPTADTAAAMVRYANLTKGYAIQYFSIGNEPDLYASQGLPSDASKPAIPNYGPSDYCATARAYVTAMKAVDPTILIVGPDLSWKYQAGNGANDWLTPILQDCGDLFDVVSIHRYPFEAAQSSLSAAAADAAQYRAVMTSVQGILQATGYGQKPLALTEMNVAYDATACVLDASPGTVGSALWIADSLGASMELGLWTSAIWDISDPETWALGFIGAAPAHQPRPEYYAYLLYAQHFGPTLLGVTSSPAGVSVYASRNTADNATQVIVANWNTATRPLTFAVTGLAAASSASPSPTFQMPAVSLAAFEIADTGATSAWVYGEAERVAGQGPQVLASGTLPSAYPDAGAGASGRTVGAGCGAGGPTCTQAILPGPAITTKGSASGANVSFGTVPNAWGSYAYAASGQSSPTATVTADGNGLTISGGFAPLANSGANWEGFGLYYSSSSCIDASSYTGVKFDFSGDLGGCGFQFGASFDRDLDTTADATRGACSSGSGNCYGPAADITAEALAVTPAAPTIQVPFASLTGGMPVKTFDSSFMVSLQWQLSTTTANPDGGACSANFTVANVSFY